MHYQHSLAIHGRLQTVLDLIETGRYSTPGLAKQIGVSVPTISRIVAALREHGHDIRAEKRRSGWRYVLASKAANPQKPRAYLFARPMITESKTRRAK
jgi:biotin operon repressor